MLLKASTDSAEFKSGGNVFHSVGAALQHRSAPHEDSTETIYFLKRALNWMKEEMVCGNIKFL